MAAVVHFLFHGHLNDFLPAKQASESIPYTFTQAPSVKDAIEAIGVPHAEVQAIIANNLAVPFNYRLQHNDQIIVYPASEKTNWTQVLQSTTRRFVLDVHLGKLAKSLRMLGFDVLYENYWNDKEIATLAENENRIVLTRDVGLLKHKVIKHGYWLRSQHLLEQLTEVIKHFQLKEHFIPLSRCLVCNTHLQVTSKNTVIAKLPPKTRLYYNVFYLCPVCDRVYWKGSHYERMKAFIAQLEGN